MGKLAMEMSTVGGGAAAAESMKAKTRGVLDAVLPSVWLVKLRFMRTKSRRLKLAASSEGHHNVGADSAPFLPKTVENCYKHGVPSPTKPTRMMYHVFSSSSSNAMDDLVQSTALTPGLTGLSLEEALYSSLNPESEESSLQKFGSQNNNKMMMMEEQGAVLEDHHDITTTSTSTPSASSIATTNSLSTSSVFSRSTYRSSLSSLRNWCKLVGDESLAVKGRDIPESLLPKPATRPPKRPPWFLGGCGSGPRNHRNTRHGSLDLDNETAFLELDAKTGLESIEEGAGEVDHSSSWPKKSESWSTTYSPATWDMELTNVEVVKNQVVVKKKSTTTSSRLDSSNMSLQSNNNKNLPLKPTLGHLFSRGSSETESPRKVHPEVLAIEYPQEKINEAAAAAAMAGPKTPTAAQRKSFSSLSSRESSFRKPWLNVHSASSEQVVGGNEGGVVDEGDLSDSQSLLKANMLTPDRLRDGKTWREQQRRPKEGENNNNTKLLMSFESFTLDSCTGDADYFGDKQEEELEEESLFGRSNTMMLPEDIHNSPVFESFLESSAKAWGIDFPSRRLSDVCRASTASMISDKSRELHCVTVQSSATESTERVKPGRLVPLQGQDLQSRRGREAARIPGTTTTSTSSSARLSTSSPSKTRSSKSRSSQDQQPQPPKRRSPSRKASPKPSTISREDTDFKLQQDMMLIDPMLHDDYHNNNGRRKSTSDRPRRSVSERSRKSVSERPVGPQRSSKHSDSSQKPKRSVAPAPAPAPQMIMSPPRNSTQQRAGVLKESVAVVVESSYDPYNDFRESMIEMIIDQDIQETGDLEELLQCYLALNEAEFHPVIVDVFTDVWHELFENINGLTG